MKKVAFFFALIVLCICAYITYPYARLYFYSLEETRNGEQTNFFVHSQTSLSELTSDLIEKGIVNDSVAFLKIARYKKLSDDKIAAGKYTIAPQTELKTLVNGFFLNRLGNGNAEQTIQVTFNNCRDLAQLCGKVARFTEVDSLSLYHFLSSPQLIDHYGFNEATFVSLFLPDTYEMYWDVSPQQFMDKMADAYKEFWSAERKDKARTTGFSQSQIATLASIVYSEQGRISDEWPIIAGLYINRLHDNWKLESDPTFRFCWKDKLKGVQRLTNEHKNIACPYNTYQIFGLPPGPICIPPKKVVDAVLNYQHNSLYFMCAKPDYSGRHNFAHSYGEHLKNARIYQNWLTKNGIR